MHVKCVYSCIYKVKIIIIIFSSGQMCSHNVQVQLFMQWCCILSIKPVSCVSVESNYFNWQTKDIFFYIISGNADCIDKFTLPNTRTHSCIREDGYQWHPPFSLASSPFLLWFSNHIQQGSPNPPSHTQKAEPYLNPAALINLTDFVNYLFGWPAA